MFYQLISKLCQLDFNNMPIWTWDGWNNKTSFLDLMSCFRLFRHFTEEHLRLPLLFCRVRVPRSLVYFVVLCRSLIALLSLFCRPLYCLSVVRFTTSDYSFGVFRLFLQHMLSLVIKFIICFFYIRNSKECWFGWKVL